MHCLSCLLADGGSQSAVAVCPHCGAGVCQQHLLVLKRNVPTSGMAVIRHARSFICTDCYQQLYAKKALPATMPGTQRAGMFSLSQLWKKLIRGNAVGEDEKQVAERLPEPAEAVAIIERFLQTRQ